MERNLLTGSSDSLLIDKSSKHCNSSSETQNLLTNEFISHQSVSNRANPIPYVQNPVYGMPKQQNIPQGPALDSGRHKKFKWSSFKKFLYGSRSSSDNRNAQKETQVRLKSKIVNGVGRFSSLELFCVFPFSK